MKSFISKVVLLTTALMLNGCGSATEVGNPTGETPVIRIVKGTLDLAEIEPEADISEFLIVASGDDGSEETSSVDEDGFFSLSLEVGLIYEMSVTDGREKIGDFRFRQRNGGTSNQLSIIFVGPDLDLGEVIFQGGFFLPENEPIDSPGFGMWSGESGYHESPSE